MKAGFGPETKAGFLFGLDWRLSDGSGLSVRRFPALPKSPVSIAVFFHIVDEPRQFGNFF
jgi:hypothetical protein